MYQVGQAVIILQDELCFVWQINDTKGGLITINGKFRDYLSFSVLRPATEAEILAEAVKHGWKVFMENETICNCTHSPNYWFGLDKYSEWEIDGSDTYTPMKNTLKEYCEEGVIAHRLITALNLAK